MKGGDILQYGIRIGHIRMMTGLSSMHGVDKLRMLDVTAIGRSIASLHGSASFAPDIALINIMIIWQANSNAFLHQITKRPAQQIPLSQIIKHGSLHALTNDAISPNVFVNLITREEKHIWIFSTHITHYFKIWKSRVLVSRKASDNKG